MCGIKAKYMYSVLEYIKDIIIVCNMEDTWEWKNLKWRYNNLGFTLVNIASFLTHSLGLYNLKETHTCQFIYTSRISMHMIEVKNIVSWCQLLEQLAQLD